MGTASPNHDHDAQQPFHQYQWRGAEQHEVPSPEPPLRPRWTLGMLNDKETDEVPGTVLLLSNADHNQPLGLKDLPHRTSASSLPQSVNSQYQSRPHSASTPAGGAAKRTADGQIVLNPQPEESANDPLNWPAWRRDAALLSLGFYCMVGGGTTPLLAAGYDDVATQYDVSSQKVALTTGFYMLGMGLGSVVMSPTAILFGKRPVYILGVVLFVATAIWCAASPSYASLLVARIFQGVAVSPVECLPSATIAEIFFLHERAYRIGIYTLLLLGGKNLIPLVSAAITQGLGWRWVFWMLAIVVGFSGSLVFLFVPETFWDRTPHPRARHHRHAHRHMSGLLHRKHTDDAMQANPSSPGAEKEAHNQRRRRDVHVGFADPEADALASDDPEKLALQEDGLHQTPAQSVAEPATPEIAHVAATPDATSEIDVEGQQNQRLAAVLTTTSETPLTQSQIYTDTLRRAPRQTFVQQLRIWSGRISQDNWFRVALRPFILFAYPAVLWSAVVYSLSVGWLIVLSEAVSEVYKSHERYNFSALGAGLVYISPFIGGILGTAIAGRLSDVLVRALARRNGGIYEPEFRLVMAIPITVATAIGLMGFGWSAEERDAWIVPTIFFGILSFGCTLGSTTAITFCVDSYRQYAGEALVTLNFSKNVFHGFVFAWFIVDWLDYSGNKTVFVSLGGIHIFFMLWSIPMYIYGKRARMWTVRKNLMERF
ncbi:hypothetical protein KEM52_000003 [Ascosphaera acerosa]|nr:hypothetical protein KEM52_000003 [Ascosphaera acerosa]